MGKLEDFIRSRMVGNHFDTIHIGKANMQTFETFQEFIAWFARLNEGGDRFWRLTTHETPSKYDEYVLSAYIGPYPSTGYVYKFLVDRRRESTTHSIETFLRQLPRYEPERGSKKP